MSHSFLQRALGWLGIASSQALRRERLSRERRFRRLMQEGLEDRRLLTGMVYITTSDPAASESGDTATVTISRFGSAVGPISVALQYNAGTANAADCVSPNYTVVLENNISSMSFYILPMDDSLVEGTENLGSRLFRTRLTEST